MNNINKNMNCSNAGYKMASAYQLISKSTDKLTTKRDALDTMCYGLQESPLTTKDEKMIAKLAQLAVHEAPWSNEYFQKHMLSDEEAVTAGEIYLKEFFTPDGKAETFENKLVSATSEAVTSVKDPKSQLKILADFQFEFSDIVKEHNNNHDSKFNPMLHSILLLEPDKYGKLDIDLEDAVKIGLVALEHMPMSGPYAKIAPKYFSDALGVVKSEKAKEWVKREEEYCADIERIQRTGAPYMGEIDQEPPVTPDMESKKKKDKYIYFGQGLAE